MQYALLFESFIKAVESEIPRNQKLSAVLAEILLIEKEAVYRRLRMEVPFSFSEIAKVSQQLGISLDNIVNSLPQKNRPMRISLIEYLEPSETDYSMIDNYIRLLAIISQMQDTEYCVSNNQLPQSLYIGYEYIERFFLFKWNHLYSDALTAKPFAEVHFTEKLREYQIAHKTEMRKMKSSHYIWDKHIFRNIVEDIQHYYSINLINSGEKEAIRRDLHRFIDEMEELACKGKFPETGNRVHFYISNIGFENCYSYFQGPNYQLSMISVFTLNEMVTQDTDAFDHIKQWMKSLKRSSTAFSGSGEKQRILFFAAQRELVDAI